MTLLSLIDAAARALLRPLLMLNAPPRGPYPEPEVLWIEVPVSAVGRSPSWMRRVGLAPDGTIYLQVAFAGDEREMEDRAIRHGQHHVTCMEYAFVAPDWIARVAPGRALHTPGGWVGYLDVRRPVMRYTASQTARR
jgi:hypothetical protein